MPKRGTYEIVDRILMCVRDDALTQAELERKVNTNFNTIKADCIFLADAQLVEVKLIKKHPSNGKPAKEIAITERGIEYLKRKQLKHSK